MATRKECDLCGRDIGRERVFLTRRVYYHRLMLDGWQIPEVESYEICRTCEKELRTWMKNRKMEGTEK